MDKNKEEVGAVWYRVGEKGTKFMTAKITINGKDYNFLFFKNNHKHNDKQPDLIVYKDEWRANTKPAGKRRR